MAAGSLLGVPIEEHVNSQWETGTTTRDPDEGEKEANHSSSGSAPSQTSGSQQATSPGGASSQTLPSDTCYGASYECESSVQPIMPVTAPIIQPSSPWWDDYPEYGGW